MRLAALVFFLALQGTALAQEDRSPPVSMPESAPTLNKACAPAMQRTQGLLRAGHNVDAHLIAQTMSFLCLEDAATWDILDAVALTKLEEHQRAYALLESIALDPGPQAAHAAVVAAWVLVKGDLGDPEDLGNLAAQDAARIRVFARIHKGHSPGSGTRALSAELRDAVTEGYARMQAINTKRPWLAGTLSALLPGLGQAYAGSWQGAGVSLVLNGLFLSATVELARHELYLASATTGFAGSIFYVGNILNAVDLAQRYNQGATEDQRVQLETLLIPEAY